MSKRFTEGIAFDGAAILDNGKPITITEILKNLNKLDKVERELKKLRLDVTPNIKPELTIKTRDNLK